MTGDDTLPRARAEADQRLARLDTVLDAAIVDVKTDLAGHDRTDVMATLVVQLQALPPARVAATCAAAIIRLAEGAGSGG